MDLLLEVKRTYEDLRAMHLIQDMPSFQEVEATTEKCFKGNYSDIEKYLNAPLSIDNINKIRDHIKSMEEIVKRDKENS